MPELPEVETVRRQLEREIKGTTIKDIAVRFGRKLEPNAREFVRRVKGRQVLGVDRRAKLLIVRLSGGMNILIHLKMTGRILLRRPTSPSLSLKRRGVEPTKHTHAIFKLSGRKEIHWEDWRKFGFMKALNDAGVDKYLQDQAYGPEPLLKSFTWQKMAMCLRAHPKKKIKPLLLEQSCLAGIGNIYAAEGVWYAKLHPMTRVAKITDAQMKQLHQGIVGVLKAAIPARGSSADSYVDVYGHQGTFVPKLKVYGRAGLPCRRCRTPLQKLKIGGRTTAFCPRCQKIIR